MTAGLLAGFAGLEHGIGELTSGDVDAHSLVIESWPHVKAFDVLGGEPAMTLIADLRVAGAVTALVSLALGWWALRNTAHVAMAGCCSGSRRCCCWWVAASVRRSSAWS